MIINLLIPLMLLISHSQPKQLLLLTDQNSRPIAYYKCLKQGGVDRVVAIYDFDNEDYVTMVMNAKNGGLGVELLSPVVWDETVEWYVKQLKDVFGVGVIDRFWVFVISEQPTGLTPQQNCQHVQDLLKALKTQFKVPVQIISVYDYWELIFGQTTFCPDFSNNGTLLWWVPDEKEQDGRPNFINYRRFGGWKEPFMKLYGSKNLCGGDQAVSYYREQ